MPGRYWHSVEDANERVTIIEATQDEYGRMSERCIVATGLHPKHADVLVECANLRMRDREALAEMARLLGESGKPRTCTHGFKSCRSCGVG